MFFSKTRCIIAVKTYGIMHILFVLITFLLKIKLTSVDCRMRGRSVLRGEIVFQQSRCCRRCFLSVQTPDLSLQKRNRDMLVQLL